MGCALGFMGEAWRCVNGQRQLRNTHKSLINKWLILSGWTPIPSSIPHPAWESMRQSKPSTDRTGIAALLSAPRKKRQQLAEGATVRDIHRPTVRGGDRCVKDTCRSASHPRAAFLAGDRGRGRAVEDRSGLPLDGAQSGRRRPVRSGGGATYSAPLTARPTPPVERPSGRCARPGGPAASRRRGRRWPAPAAPRRASAGHRR